MLVVSSWVPANIGAPRLVSNRTDMRNGTRTKLVNYFIVITNAVFGRVKIPRTVAVTKKYVVRFGRTFIAFVRFKSLNEPPRENKLPQILPCDSNVVNVSYNSE